MTHEDALDFITRVQWQFARTMPQWPHWYTIRKWHPELDEAHTAFIKLVLTEGKIKPWPSGRPRPRHHNIYLVIGDYEYWTILEDHAPSAVNVINRCEPGWDA